MPGSFAYSPTNGQVLNAGTNTLSAVFTPSDTADYNTATGTVSLVVLPAPLTVTASNATRPYGQANPVLTVTITGLTNGDNITATYTCSATPSSPPDPYPIVPSLNDPSSRLGNYTVTTNNGTLTVTCQAVVLSPATLPAATVGQAYSQTLSAAGGAVPYTFAVTVGSLPAGLSLASSGALSGSPSVAGTNTFTARATDTNACAGSQAYTVTVVKGTGTVTLGNLNPTYDGTAKSVSAATAPPGLSVNLTYNGSANAPTNAGSYTVVGAIVDLNYQGSATNTLVVGKAAPVLTWTNPAAITYGTALSAAQLNAMANLPGTNTYSPPLGAVLGAGTNTLSVTFTPTDTTNYTAAATTVSLVVQPAPLTVTASAQSKSYGQTLSFGSGSTQFTSTGLQNGETIGSVTLMVSGNGGAATAPVSGSPYTITPSAATGGTFNANNYAMTYNSGALTVNPAPLAVTANAQSKTYGQTVTFGSGSSQFTSSGLQNGETIGSVTLAVSGNGGAATAPPGTYTITPSAATGGTFSASNHTISYNTGTLTVTSSSVATWTPLPLTPSSFTYEIVVPASYTPLSSAFCVTVTMDNGPATNSIGILPGTAWYEIGANPAALGTGLPHAGSLVTNQFQPDHIYRLASSWAANNCLFITPGPSQPDYSSGTLTLNQPRSYTALSLLLSAANGPCSMTFTITYADASTNSGAITAPDWFGYYGGSYDGTNGLYGDACYCLSASGRVDITGGFENVGSSDGCILWSVDLPLTKTAVAVESIRFSGPDYGGCSIFALSGSTSAAQPATGFSPVAVAGYNADVVVEAPANPASFPYTATMDNGTNFQVAGSVPGGRSTWFEVGYDPIHPTNGFPAHGSTLVSPATGISYQMAPSYLAPMSVLIDANHQVANIIPANPQPYTAFSFLTAGGSICRTTSMTNIIIVQHADGTSESNLFYGTDWFNPLPAPAYVANGCVNFSNGRQLVSGRARGSRSAAPHLFESEFQMQNTRSAVTNIQLRFWQAPASNSTTFIMAVSAAAGVLDPTLSWTPAPINYGAPLTSDQLNATAGVPGTFAYNPPSGTVLSPGIHTLSVTFTPTDTADYNSVTKSVSLVAPPIQVLYSFTPAVGFTNSDGANPCDRLVLSGNTLYGTTFRGGSAGTGTVFKVNTDGSGLTNLYSFTGGSDGANPYAGLVLSGNTLYGAASYGGNGGNGGNGTVFAINTNGSGFTNLHSFTRGSDGAGPYGDLILSGSTLYGTAVQDGSAGFGTVFKVNTDGSGFTNLYNFTAIYYPDFTNSDGGQPQAGLVLSGSTLYGTAGIGGSNALGTVFAINTNGSGFTNLHSFTLGEVENLAGYVGCGDYNQNNQYAALILSGNTLYGTSEFGGSANNGAVFAINTNGSSFTNLYSFTGGSDGAHPEGSVILSSNTLYGTAEYGGSANNGTVFALHLAAGSIAPPPVLNIQLTEQSVVLSWNAADTEWVLQSAPSLTGVFTNIPGGTSPYTNSLIGAQQFFRLMGN